jgi:hypothetical protein
MRTVALSSSSVRPVSVNKPDRQKVASPLNKILAEKNSVVFESKKRHNKIVIELLCGGLLRVATICICELQFPNAAAKLFALSIVA